MPTVTRIPGDTIVLDLGDETRHYTMATATQLRDDLIKALQTPPFPQGPATGTLFVNHRAANAMHAYSCGSMSWEEFCSKSSLMECYLLHAGSLHKLDPTSGKFKPFTDFANVLTWITRTEYAGCYKVLG